MTQPLPEGAPWERTTFGITSYYNPYSGRYTTNRDYGLRMQRKYQAGVPGQIARGHRPGEAARRREREEAAGVLPYAVRFEQRYGFSYRYWRRLQRTYLKDLHARTAKGGWIRPWMVKDVKDLYEIQHWRDLRRPELTTWEAWVEVHLGERLWATILYQEDNDTAYGSYNFVMRSSNPPIEFWYYH